MAIFARDIAHFGHLKFSDGINSSMADEKKRVREERHANGQLKSRTTTAEDKYNWKLCEEWYDNGQMLERSEYRTINGQKHRSYTIWHDNGIMSSRGYEVDNRTQGLSESWHSNGNIKSMIGRYEERFVGPCTTWHENGKMESRFVARFEADPDLYETWWSNGNPHKVERRVNGVLHGTKAEYYENGHLSYQFPYVGGKFHGLEKLYHENGQLNRRLDYVDGMPHGLLESFHEDGSRSQRNECVAGNLHGLCEVWKQGDSKAEHCYYKLDKRITAEQYTAELKTLGNVVSAVCAFSESALGLLVAAYNDLPWPDSSASPSGPITSPPSQRPPPKFDTYTEADLFLDLLEPSIRGPSGRRHSL